MVAEGFLLGTLVEAEKIYMILNITQVMFFFARVIVELPIWFLLVE